jgi:hypothetical protein
LLVTITSVSSLCPSLWLPCLTTLI